MQLGLTLGSVRELEISEDVGGSASHRLFMASALHLRRLGHPQSITLDALCCLWHDLSVAWDVEGTDEFVGWFESLSDEEQVSVGRVVELLVEHGASLPFPYPSGIATSRHRHMRELRIQHEGRREPCCGRVRPAASRDSAAGRRQDWGNDCWYDEHVPIADKLDDEYLRELQTRRADMKRHKWTDIKARTKA